MTPHPPNPSQIPKIDVTTHRAEIRTHDGWWYRYVVHRSIGVVNPEMSTSLHRTLKGAQRAAARWCAKTPTDDLVERWPKPQPILPSPMVTETRD